VYADVQRALGTLDVPDIIAGLPGLAAGAPPAIEEMHRGSPSSGLPSTSTPEGAAPSPRADLVSGAWHCRPGLCSHAPAGRPMRHPRGPPLLHDGEQGRRKDSAPRRGPVRSAGHPPWPPGSPVPPRGSGCGTRPKRPGPGTGGRTLHRRDRDHRWSSGGAGPGAGRTGRRRARAASSSPPRVGAPGGARGHASAPPGGRQALRSRGQGQQPSPRARCSPARRSTASWPGTGAPQRAWLTGPRARTCLAHNGSHGREHRLHEGGHGRCHMPRPPPPDCWPLRTMSVSRGPWRRRRREVRAHGTPRHPCSA